MSDMDEILHRLRGLIGEQDPDQIMAFVHPGAPVSKARARWNARSRSFYTPSTTIDAQKALSWRFKGAMAGRPPYLGPVAIVAIFVRHNRQRIDADNLMKLVMDAATKALVWRDDSQVAAQAAIMELDRDKPRTIIAVCPYLSSLDRAPLVFTCKRCGAEYEQPEWYQRRNKGRGQSMFCSKACARPIELVAATCPRCNQPFPRKTAGQRYCSNKCANQSRGVRLPNGEQRPPALCELCGKRVSRREYRQCRACRGYGRPSKQVINADTKGPVDAVQPSVFHERGIA